MPCDKIPRILTIDRLTLAGMSVRTTSDDMMTIDLWRRFMPRKKEIMNTVDDATYSIQLFDEIPDYNSLTVFEFTKWGAVEVSAINQLPEGMELLTVDPGLYAVFTHYGVSAAFGETMHYILGTWLPSSTFKLADRPHLARMDDRYLGPNNPDSEEDIYLPIDPVK